jgi:hypothetical protein
MMECMRRWLFHIAAGSSLLLCLALLALWINSLSQQYMFDVQFPDSPNASPYVLRLISLRSAEGGFWIHEQVITVTSPPEIATYAAVSGASIRTNFGTVQNPPMYTGLSQLKFDWAPRFVNASDPGVTQTKAWLRVPDWFLMLLAAILPGLWIAGYRRHQRRMLKGHCLNCGYDLRATPQRCPECGTLPASQAAGDVG